MDSSTTFLFESEVGPARLKSSYKNTVYSDKAALLGLLAPGVGELQAVLPSKGWKRKFGLSRDIFCCTRRYAYTDSGLKRWKETCWLTGADSEEMTDCFSSWSKTSIKDLNGELKMSGEALLTWSKWMTIGRNERGQWRNVKGKRKRNRIGKFNHLQVKWLERKWNNVIQVSWMKRKQCLWLYLKRRNTTFICSMWLDVCVSTYFRNCSIELVANYTWWKLKKTR